VDFWVRKSSTFSVCTQTKNLIYNKILYRGWLNLIQIENSGYLKFVVGEGFQNIESKRSKRYPTNPLLYWYFCKYALLGTRCFKSHYCMTTMTLQNFFHGTLYFQSNAESEMASSKVRTNEHILIFKNNCQIWVQLQFGHDWSVIYTFKELDVGLGADVRVSPPTYGYHCFCYAYRRVSFLHRTNWDHLGNE
jgi:hypothetical protein